MAPLLYRSNMDPVTEADWQTITLIDQEEDHKTRKPKRWGSFPQSVHPDRIFFYPDLHFPYVDYEFLEYLDARCDEFSPTHIIQVGDILDCYTLSDFEQDPARKESFNDERNATVSWLSERRQKHPDSIFAVLEGNHEERLRRQVLKRMPGLHDLPELSIPSLLKFAPLNIRHYRSDGFVGWGMRIKHGNSTAKYAANVELNKHWSDGISGHTHRKMEATFTTAEGHTYTWRSLGHCCDMDKADYVKGPNWQQAGGQLLAHPSGEREWEWLEG